MEYFWKTIPLLLLVVSCGPQASRQKNIPQPDGLNIEKIKDNISFCDSFTKVFSLVYHESTEIINEFPISDIKDRDLI